MHDSLNSDIEELLRELLVASGAERVSLNREADKVPESGKFIRLGKETILIATFSSSSPQTLQSPPLQSPEELLEHTSRAIRACLKRHNGQSFPLLTLPNDKPEPRHLILARIQQFLSGLVDTSSLYQMVLLYHGQQIASAVPLVELDTERLDFLVRQLHNAAKKSLGSNHGELVRDDIYACTFWYGAALIGFAHTDYSVDFVRHRCKLVSRELTHLLSMLLHTDPDSPAAIAPIP